MSEKTLGDIIAKEMGLKTLEVTLAEDAGSVDAVVAVLRKLLSELEQGHTDDWENPTLERYLEAMSAWLESVGPNVGKPSWKFIEIMLGAAKHYE